MTGSGRTGLRDMFALLAVKQMNLFVIPSWYPSRARPLSGIFIREQVEALAELRPDINVLVSLWGHEDTFLSPRDLRSWSSAFFRRCEQAADQILVRNGVHEVRNAKLHWSRRLPLGGANQLVDVNRRNFGLAVRRFGPIDLIHTHVSYPGGYLAALLSKEFGVPYVLTEHMGPFPFPSLARNGVPVKEVAFAFEAAAQTMAVSPALAGRIASFGYPAPTVIPNMVDDRAFFVGLPSSDKIIFLSVCGISEHKGIDHLLEAIALWDPPAEQFEFRIGGDGPMRPSYESKARALGVDDRVKWLGGIQRTEVPGLFRDCHIFVLPSRHETFGVVYAEAIASGKPVIATRCGGPESIVNELNGKLVGVGDVPALAHAMAEMASNLQRYDARVIRKDFESRFSRAAVIDKLGAVYSNVLRG